MIKINNRNYAKNDIEACANNELVWSGYYKKTKSKILFMDIDHNIFAALVKNKHGEHFVNARKVEGKIFYQFALSDKNETIFGLRDLTYSDKIQTIKKMAEDLL